jgi:hypothetical protein
MATAWWPTRTATKCGLSPGRARQLVSRFEWLRGRPEDERITGRKRGGFTGSRDTKDGAC